MTLELLKSETGRTLEETGQVLSWRLPIKLLRMSQDSVNQGFVETCPVWKRNSICSCLVS